MASGKPLMKEEHRLLGILGGMGPEATVYFFQEIVEQTEAEKDQDHIPILIYNYPQIPDRTFAYLGEGKSPANDLLYGIRKLEDAGADLIAIPCNSAHLWIEYMQKNAKAEIINMIDLALKEFREPDKVGILGTTLTVKSKLYENPLKIKGVEVLLPENQEMVMDQIRLIKGGQIEQARKKLLEMAGDLIDRGATHILAGCTEIPLALRHNDLKVPFVDPMRLMASECIKKMGRMPKTETVGP